MANNLEVFRDGEVIAAFNIDESTIYNGKLNGTRTITCPVKSAIVLDLAEGDYILHDSEVYIISTLPEFEKDGSLLQKSYNITFEHELYLLLDTFVVNAQGLLTFPMYGDAEAQLNMVFSNANRNGTGWAVGEVEATAGQVMNYDRTYVRTALDDIAAAFKLEWSFVGRTIRMVSQVGVDTGLTFEVGRGKGLHAIKRSSDASKSVVTRVWGQGGSRNIDYTYRGGTERNLIFEGRYVETPGVTAGTERVREGFYSNEDIYPSFEGAVTGVTSESDADGLVAVSVISPTIDFDIMAHLQEGVTAKISFRTGALTGAEFEISGYDVATHTIEFIPFADTNGYVLPNDLNMPVAGDKFTLLDLRMPDSYKVAAELELRNETQQYLDDNKLARLLFDATPDERHLRSNNIRLHEGDRATVIETDAGVNEVLRFTEITYPLVNPFKVTAVVGNEIKYNRVVKLFAEVLQTQRDIQAVDRRSAELAKRGVKDLRAFEDSVFDTDGKFDSDKFNVGVLTAILGIFGAKSQNFKLNGVYITDNYLADATRVAITGGELIHFEIENAGTDGNIWTITGGTYDVPVSASLYYVYARVSRTAQVGTWVVTMDQIKPEDEAGYYHFLAGVVYPVIDGWRNSDFTNGIADINGNRLKIGKILSRDGLTGFDLDAGTIFGKITFASGSSGYANITDKPDLSVFATQDFVDAIKDELQGQIDGSITTWFYNYVPTLVNAPANSWGTVELQNQHLGDLFYNKDTGYAYRFQLEGGVYSWDRITDTDVTLALAKAQEAQDTADGKRRVFTATPVTPYDVGDLWSQGTGGDLMRCYTARASGAYVSGDWGLASKYTDDTAANAVQSNLDTLANGLGGMAYEDVVQLAKLGNTIIEGGYIKSVLIEVSALIVRGNLETATGAQAKADAAQAAAEAAAAAQLAGLVIGGRNLFQNSAIERYSSSDYLNAGSIEEILRDNVDKEITISFDFKTSIAGEAMVYSQNYGDYRFASQYFQGTTTYKRQSFTVVPIYFANAGFPVLEFYTGYGSGGDISVKNIKIEVGNKPTDWTPAPEDLIATAEQAADDAEAAAIAYADAQDELKAIEAAAYADGQVDAEEARAIADANAKLALAYADATSKANAAQSAAIAAAAADAQIKADAALEDAQAAAEAYADAQDALKEISTKAYADGIVDAEEARAIADATAKLAEAKADATTKANAAQSAAVTAAQADATAKANAAETAAQVYAAAQAAYERDVAIAHADGIVTDEEAARIAADAATVATAAADATAKAEAARVAAELAAALDATAKANAIQVGGRNFFLNSDTEQITAGNYLNAGDINEFLKNNIGKKITIGFDFKTTIAGEFIVFSLNYGDYHFDSQTLNATTEYQRFFFTTTPRYDPLSGMACLEFYTGYGANGGISVKNIKIERGTRATDWTPAPEDVSADAQAKADAALASANSIALGYAQSKADIAQAAAISAAASDATGKANAAQSAAYAAAQTYASTVANSAATAAQVAAAADALIKANAAQAAAEATAASAQAALTASLKSLAYLDIVEVAKLGSTVITGGKIVTTLLDVDWLQANVVKADYINTLALDASVIQTGLLSATRIDVANFYAQKLAAVEGTIAGFTLDGNGIVNESVYKSGVLQTGQGNARWVASKKFLNSSNVQIGNADVAFGSYTIPGYGNTQNTLGFIENGEPGKTVNTALMLSAYGASSNNVALRIESGSIVTKGWTGVSQELNAGGAHLKFVDGLFVGNW